MKIRNIIKSGLVWLVLGLGLSIVQPVRGQAGYPTALFQYAIFYNGLLEFTDCAPLSLNGQVYCNSNIYVGCPSSSSTLAFNYLVACSGIITNPAWWGYPQSSYIAGNITYNGTPSPGYITGAAPVTLPFGNSGGQIIQLPGASDSPSNVISLQRYYYKADLVILVTNITTTNVAVNVSIKNSLFDVAPLTISYTNYSYAASTNFATSNGIYAMNTNWAWWFGNTNSLTNWQTSWLTTNASFFDSRQDQTNHVTQIDVGQFGNWIATNTNCLAKWNSNTPFNGIIYVADMRTTNGMYMDCVRLTNGQYIPTIGASNVIAGGSASTNYAYAIPGLTVATINPLYIAGIYNCPSNANLASTNTTGTAPCSVVCDAITLLSSSWRDGSSWTEASGGSVPTASSSDTVNTAIIAGNVPSTGSSAIQYSGGVVNLTRLLENWSSSTLWLNTSFVNLYPSAQATAQYENPGVYYTAPTRHFSFDLNFTNVAMLPPGTPLFNQYPATVILSNLTQVYTGSPLAQGVATEPPGLSASITYLPLSGSGGLTTNAVNAGTYFITVTATNAAFLGVATNVFTITTASAKVTLSNLKQTYDGTPKSVTVTTTPAGLGVNVRYGGLTNAPVIASSYPVTAIINDSNYFGGVTNALLISKAAATVNLTNLTQTYDGMAESVLATTIPPGLVVDLTYNGAASAPTNSGSYVVIGTVEDLDYQGGATNTLVITPLASAPITLGGSTILANGTFQLSFTNTPGASFSVLGSADPTAPVADWTVLGNAVEVSSGQFQFIDLDATNQSLQFYMISSP